MADARTQTIHRTANNGFTLQHTTHTLTHTRAHTPHTQHTHAHTQSHTCTNITMAHISTHDTIQWHACTWIALTDKDRDGLGPPLHDPYAGTPWIEKPLPIANRPPATLCPHKTRKTKSNNPLHDTYMHAGHVISPSEQY